MPKNTHQFLEVILEAIIDTTPNEGVKREAQFLLSNLVSFELANPFLTIGGDRQDQIQHLYKVNDAMVNHSDTYNLVQGDFGKYLATWYIDDVFAKYWRK